MHSLRHEVVPYLQAPACKAQYIAHNVFPAETRSRYRRLLGSEPPFPSIAVPPRGNLQLSFTAQRLSHTLAKQQTISYEKRRDQERDEEAEVRRMEREARKAR